MNSTLSLIMLLILETAIKAFMYAQHRPFNRYLGIARLTSNSVSRIPTKLSNSPKGTTSTDTIDSDEALIDTKIPDKFKSSFLSVLLDRGFIHQCTDFKGLDDKFSDMQSPVVAYLGFDATAKSLHVGSLLQIMILRHLQKSGHKPIILIGGGTTKVGDPTG